MTSPEPGKQNSSGLIAIIGATNNYFKFLVLLILIVQAVLGFVALHGQGQSQLIALYSFIFFVVLMVAVICFFAYYKPNALTSASLQQLQDFCERVSGHWWELVLPDESSAISFVTVFAEASTNTLIMSGTSYDRRGVRVAKWETTASCIYLPKDKVFYYWEGWRASHPDEKYEGFGEITFDHSPGRIDRGSGMFSDANLRDLKDAARRRTIFKRCTKDEAKTVHDGDTKTIADLIQKVWQQNQ